MNHTFKSLQTYSVNMLDPIHWSFGYSRLWPAYSQNRARLNKLEEGHDHVVQNQPRSDLDGLVRFWPNTSCPEASQCARITRPRFWQNAASPLPVSHFHSFVFFRRQPRSYCAKPAWIGFGSGCVRFWPNGSGLQASQSARIIGPVSAQPFRANLDQM